MQTEKANPSRNEEQEWLTIAAQKESQGLPVAALMARNQAFWATQAREQFQEMLPVPAVRS